MILLTQKIGQGPTRRCDSRCYNAKGGKCACICGGKNHCAGFDKALDNVRDLFLGQNTDDKPESGKGIPQVTRKAERALNRMSEQTKKELSA